MGAAALSQNENIILSIWILTVKTAGSIHGHILDVLCTSKFLTTSACHYVKDGISDHLTVFFTTTFPVRNFLHDKMLKSKKTCQDE